MQIISAAINKTAKNAQRSSMTICLLVPELFLPLLFMMTSVLIAVTLNVTFIYSLYNTI